ncbi:MAG: hypothetical protein V7K89_08365 [Nostoc sp.]|uniref:hypothetical protein n=1 Tax=Nostoc sp. TaxID=1180 RepID=UPI002FFAA703
MSSLEIAKEQRAKEASALNLTGSGSGVAISNSITGNGSRTGNGNGIIAIACNRHIKALSAVQHRLSICMSKFGW